MTELPFFFSPPLEYVLDWEIRPEKTLRESLIKEAWFTLENELGEDVLASARKSEEVGKIEIEICAEEGDGYLSENGQIHHSYNLVVCISEKGRLTSPQ